jgi:hypothetical protein
MSDECSWKKKIYGLENYEEDYYNDDKVGK